MRIQVGVLCFAAAIVLGASPGSAQRDRIRQAPRADRSTAVTESQASELTLTVTEAAVRPIQVWVRTAGTVDKSRRSVTAAVQPLAGTRVKVGQRIRVFSPASRSRMYQATVTRVAADPHSTTVTAQLSGQTLEASRHFVLEIVTEEGEFLSVPNEAIIEAGDNRVVYVRQTDGSYRPRDVVVGVQGELYTQIVDGLSPGEQVVTTGSFFIDAEHKLKGS